MMEVVKITPEKIHHSIASMVSRGVPYIEAIIHFAEENDLEIETVASIVKKSSILKEKIRSEAIENRTVRKEEENNDVTSICE